MFTRMENQGLNQPIISIVIPFFNDGAYIDDAVDSILNQSYQNTEIIIVNDGSTDPDSVEKISQYNKPRTTVYHKENGHLSSARNYGFARAQGEYVLTLDADDMFEPTFITKAAKILDEQPEMGAVSAWVAGFGYQSFTWEHLQGGGLENFVTQNNSVACALIRKSIWLHLGGYDENMKEGYEDWEFWINMTKSGWAVYIIKEHLFKYRQKKQSMILNTQKKHLEIYQYILVKHSGVLSVFWLSIIQAKNADIRYLEELVRHTKLYREQEIYESDILLKRVYASTSYRVGNFMVAPFSFMKRYFS